MVEMPAPRQPKEMHMKWLRCQRTETTLRIPSSKDVWRKQQSNLWEQHTMCLLFYGHANNHRFNLPTPTRTTFPYCNCLVLKLRMPRCSIIRWQKNGAMKCVCCGHCGPPPPPPCVHRCSITRWPRTPMERGSMQPVIQTSIAWWGWSSGSGLLGSNELV